MANKFHPYTVLRTVGVILLVALGINALLGTTHVSHAQSATYCAAGQMPQFVLGFAELAAELGEEAGEPLECEHHDGEGNGYQMTTTGMMYWEKSTSELSFTPTPVMAPTTGPTSATAQIIDVQHRTVGTATFTTTDSGEVRIQVSVSGYNPGSGGHGIHIHQMGVCEPPFTSAGDHYNPTMQQHGLENPEGAHGGDLPNMQFFQDGSGTYDATTDRITLVDGPLSVFDADGSAIVIHAGPDDQMTDPSGNSGDRIGCGVIVPTP